MSFDYGKSEKDKQEITERKKLYEKEKEDKVFHRRCSYCYHDKFFVTWSGMEVCSLCFGATMNVDPSIDGPTYRVFESEKQIEKSYKRDAKKQGLKYEKGSGK